LQPRYYRAIAPRNGTLAVPRCGESESSLRDRRGRAQGGHEGQVDRCCAKGSHQWTRRTAWVRFQRWQCRSRTVNQFVVICAGSSKRPVNSGLREKKHALHGSSSICGHAATIGTFHSKHLVRFRTPTGRRSATVFRAKAMLSTKQPLWSLGGNVLAPQETWFPTTSPLGIGSEVIDFSYTRPSSKAVGSPCVFS
jgi:hypothetical protein